MGRPGASPVAVAGMSKRVVPPEITVVTVFYESPWERMMGWLWRIPRDRCLDLDEIEDVPAGGWRDRLGSLCDILDARWRRRWAFRYAQGRKPPERWKRPPPPDGR